MDAIQQPGARFGALSSAFVANFKRRISWVAEFYCGCLAYHCPSFYCLPCARTDDAVMIGIPSTPPAFDEHTRLRATSAASWTAILAGATVAVSLSLVLLTLGAGLGFASISPWSDHGLSAKAVTVTGTIWLIVTQWLSAAAGGYVAGRLRQRWLATHTHEVFFRDTAHGLVTWGVATLFVAAVLAGSFTGLIGGGVHARGALLPRADKVRLRWAIRTCPERTDPPVRTLAGQQGLIISINCFVVPTSLTRRTRCPTLSGE